MLSKTQLLTIALLVLSVANHSDDDRDDEGLGNWKVIQKDVWIGAWSTLLIPKTIPMLQTSMELCTTTPQKETNFTASRNEKNANNNAKKQEKKPGG